MTQITLEQVNRLKYVDEECYKYRNLAAYLEQRPYAAPHRTWQEQLYLWSKGIVTLLDCSAWTITRFRYAGLKDPTFRNFDGYGDTQDMLNSLPTADWHRLHYGSIIVATAGPLSTQHVCTVIQPNGYNPEVINHGGPGIGKMPLSWLKAAMPGRQWIPKEIHNLG
jgi:hypothetical protein